MSTREYIASQIDLGIYPAELGDTAWLSYLDYDESKRELVVRNWLRLFNRQWHSAAARSKDPAHVLHRMVAQHTEWIATIQPHIVAGQVSRDDYDGTLAKLVSLSGDRHCSGLTSECQDLIAALWFDREADSFKLVERINSLWQDSAAADPAVIAPYPYFGQLLPNLAWQALERLPKDYHDYDQFCAIAGAMTCYAAIELPRPLSEHVDLRCLCWSTLAWHTFHEECIDITDYQGINIAEVIQQLPLATKVAPLEILLLLTQMKVESSTKSWDVFPICQKLCTCFTVFSGVRAWLPGHDKLVDIAEATGSELASLMDAILACNLQDTDGAQALPEDLVDA